jgi:hypothetical protein
MPCAAVHGETEGAGSHIAQGEERALYEPGGRLNERFRSRRVCPKLHSDGAEPKNSRVPAKRFDAMETSALVFVYHFLAII